MAKCGLILTFLLILINALPAQDKPDEGPAYPVKELYEKVNSDKPAKYLDLISFIFPKAAKNYHGGERAADGHVVEYDVTRSNGAIALRDLHGKKLITARTDDLTVGGVIALRLGTDNRHIALIMHAEPKPGSKRGDLYALAVFDLSGARPRLMASYGSLPGQKLTFRSDQAIESEDRSGAEFWVTASTGEGSGTSDTDYTLLEARGTTARVIAGDFPLVHSETACGFKQTSDFAFFTRYNNDDQDEYYKGRVVYRFEIVNDWSATPCGAVAALPENNRRSRLEYELYWNPALGRYQNRLMRDEINLTGDSSPLFVIDKDFKGFAVPHRLDGKAAFLKTFEASLYPGEDDWRWKGDFNPAGARRSEIDWRMPYDMLFFPQDTEIKRLDVRYMIISVDKMREKNGPMITHYSCQIIAAVKH